jgi:hypothetical protein
MRWPQYREQIFTMKKGILWGLLITSIVLPALIYILKFSSLPISEDDSKWANFSTYLGGFFALANVAAFVVLTLEIHQYNLNRDRESRRYSELVNQPVISFYSINKASRYNIHNVGRGAAINVVVRGHFHNNHWQNAYMLYAIAPDVSKELTWSQNCNKLMAEYYDISGRKYISFMDNDTLRVIDCGDEQSLKRFREEYEIATSSSVQPTWS